MFESCVVRRPVVFRLDYLSLLALGRFGRRPGCIWKRKWWVCPGLLESYVADLWQCGGCGAVVWPFPGCCPAECALARWSPKHWNCVQSRGRAPGPALFGPRETTSSQVPVFLERVVSWDRRLRTHSSGGRLVTLGPDCGVCPYRYVWAALDFSCHHPSELYSF